MVKLTSNQLEVEYLLKLINSIMSSEKRIFNITTNLGETIVGIEIKSRHGNNATEALRDGISRYYGEITLLTTKDQEVTIDLLDIKEILPASTSDISAMKQILVKRGMIKMDDLVTLKCPECKTIKLQRIGNAYRCPRMNDFWIMTVESGERRFLISYNTDDATTDETRKYLIQDD